MLNNWLNRLTNAFHTNTSPADMAKRYGVLTDWIYDPDMSAVAGQPDKYWSITGDVVSLMSQTERDAVDAAEAQAEIDADRIQQKARMNERLLKALAVYFAKEINILRGIASLPPRTVQQVRQGILDEVDKV